MPAFNYIDSLDSNQHILLLYQEQEYAQLIEFRFIKNGLIRNEVCVYATDEDSGRVVLKMLAYGIPVKYFHNGMLKVFQIQNKDGGINEIIKKSRVELKRILSGLKNPFRIVSRIVPDVDNVNGISAELEIEQEVHRKFESIGCSLICPYNVSKIEPRKRLEWIKKLSESHHVVIYASKFGESKVLSGNVG